MSDKLINILLIANHPAQSELVEQALADCSNTLKFIPETAANLSEAVELLNHKNFDAILLNLEKSDNEGINAVKKICTSNPCIPLIAVTNQDDEEMLAQTIKNGADDCLIKGKFFKDLLGRTIRCAIERKSTESNQSELLEKLENAERQLKDFTYIISHDLKAPLRAIKSLTGWISSDYADKVDDQGKEQLDLLTAQVTRMNSLMEGVLQYSRIGRICEKQVRVDLNKIVSEVIDAIDPAADIDIKVENKLPTISCERIRITQVFQNLIDNAVKYMDKPKGQIKITCAEENGFYKFSVADNGPGIEEKHFERIFQIFQTLAPKDNYEHTGVGLTLTKKIVEVYGGKIWLQSEVGKGTTFFFTLLGNEGSVVENEELQTSNVG